MRGSIRPGVRCRDQHSTRSRVAIATLTGAKPHPLLLEAIRALEAAGLDVRPVDQGAGTGPEALIALREGARPSTEVRSLLAASGFAELSSGPGRGRHFASYDRRLDQWLRLTLVPDRPPEQIRKPSAAEWLLRMYRRALDAGRPRSISVALVGPDGAGKSTLSAALASTFLLPVRPFYAGLYPAGTRHYPIRGLGTLAQLLRLWRMTIRATYHRWRGRLVLFDRYAYDALLPPPDGRRRLARWRRALLARSVPAPDLLIVLDAPTHVLRSRRDEQPDEVVEAQRRRYAELARATPHAVVVDASAAPDAVRRQVTALIWRRYASRRGGLGG